MASPRTELRMVAGFALMPPTAAALAFVASLVLWGGRNPQGGAAGSRVTSGGSDPFDVAVSLAMGALLVAVVVTVFAAVPAVAWLNRRGPRSLRSLLLLGAALGNAPFGVGVILMFVSRMAHGTLPDNPGDMWYGSAGAFRAITSGLFVGMASAAVFWIVALRGTELDARESDG